MSDYDFFNRMINRIDKDYGYDIANRFQRLFIKRENESIELQDRIDRAIEYIKENREIRTFYTPEQRWEVKEDFIKGYYELLEILGDKENE